MPEQISKFQPNRTVSLRGFDRRGAAAALHSATGTGFTLSGVFRDQADFAVGILYDADDYYEHPLMRYLPDFELGGMKLEFDVNLGAGLQPIDSPKYNWINWASLACILKTGEPKYISLWENSALQAGTFTAASGTFTLTGSIASFDRVILWIEKLPFDFVAGVQNPSIEFPFFASGAGTVHSITIDGTTYSYTELPGNGSGDVAIALRNLVNAGGGNVNVTASIGSAAHYVQLTLKAGRPNIVCSASGSGAGTIGNIQTLSDVANNLAYQCNTANWPSAGPLFAVYATPSGANITFTAARYGQVTSSGTTVTLSGPIAANNNPFVGLQAGNPFYIDGFQFTVASVQSPTQLTLTAAPGMSGKYLAPRGGRDGNMIEMYRTNKTATLTTSADRVKFTGGSSAATWRVSLDFTALGIDQLRQAWVTLAPELTDSAAFPSAGIEFSAAFSNFNIAADPSGRKWLKYAGKGTVRIPARDARVEREGTWAIQDGFYNEGFCLVSNTNGSKLTVRYSCDYAHDLYLGTSLYSDRGIVSVSIDGGTAFNFDVFTNCEPPIVNRRKLNSGAQLAAGDHVVTFTVTNQKHTSSAVWDMDSLGYYFHFDYLEAAANIGDLTLPSDANTYANVMPATDYDTDHTYKIAPARLVWSMYGCGFRGQFNHYVGVFWWNQRKRVLAPGDAAFNSATVTFGGTWVDGETVFLRIGPSGTLPLGKGVIGAFENPLVLAHHFKAMINETSIGVWAEVSGNTTSATLTITTRSPYYEFELDLQKTSAAGTATLTGDCNLGEDGDWIVDETITPVLNRAARDWHSDFCSQVAAKSNTVSMALSMEIVNPPDDPLAGKVWAARFWDGTVVKTATGFNQLNSTHCAFGSDFLAYHKQAFKELAGLQATASLVPWIQFGEFLWWFFDGQDGVHEGMAFYDDRTKADANTALGRALVYFDTINSPPSVNSYADANFLRSRIKSHVDAIRSFVSATYATTKYEILYAHDVNYPITNSFGIGGALNTYVNFPIEYRAKAGSGLDRLKMESLSFGAQERNLDKQKEVISFPWTSPNTWAKADSAYLIPIFNAGCPWPKEYLHAKDAGTALLNMWAWDHIVLISWPLPLPVKHNESKFV